MWVSLTEIESTALKAARNAGYSAALAGSAASAARWLAMRGLPFLKPLTSGVLRQMHRLESADSSCQTGSSYGPNIASNLLGPVSVLTALADELLVIPLGSEEISFRRLAAPILLLPALSRLSRRSDRSLLVRWPGVAIECRAGEALTANASGPGLECLAADWFTVSYWTGPVAEPESASNLRRQGAELDPADWTFLKSLANRTFVAEAETSRLHGANAGAYDRD
jgi:Protein of unknown function (DUF3726)